MRIFRAHSGIEPAPYLPLVSKSARLLSYLQIGESYRKLDVAEKTGALPPGPPPPPRLFSSEVLNQSIILKMVDARLARRVHAPDDTLRTIVFLPFKPGDEGLGGAAFDLGDERGLRSLQQTAGGLGNGERWRLSERDERILDAIAALPSVDPFLMRDAVERIGIEAHETYFDLTDEQWQAIRDYVIDHFGVLARRLYPDDAAHAREGATHLADALWRPRGNADLSELAAILRVPVGHAHDMMYAWKGLLYYKLSAAPALDAAQELRTWIMAAFSFNEPPRRELLAAIDEARTSIDRGTLALIERLKAVMSTYDRGFEALTDPRGSARPLLDAIVAAPAEFHRAGVALGSLRHGVEIWRSLTARLKRPPTLKEYMKWLQLLAGILVAREDSAS